MSNVTDHFLCLFEGLRRWSLFRRGGRHGRVNDPSCRQVEVLCSICDCVQECCYRKKNALALTISIVERERESVYILFPEPLPPILREDAEFRINSFSDDTQRKECKPTHIARTSPALTCKLTPLTISFGTGRSSPPLLLFCILS